METARSDVASCIPSEKNSILIAEVKKFPSLYDTSDSNYYVLAERNKAWLQVAENCRESAELCHLRWKSLRKRFAKEKRRIPEILQGRRRPWALFPKMSFLTPTTAKRRIKPVKGRRKSAPSSVPVEFKQNPSDDDMLIVDDNDEIVHTCKSTEMSEEDEYIYETLDDPDSALQIMKEKPPSQVKPTAIRSGNTAVPQAVARYGGSGRIRKVTPKMQNSIIAKKLKQAQQVLQQTPKTITVPKTTIPQKVTILHKKTTSLNKSNAEKSVLFSDQIARHVATVNPNIIRVERLGEKETQPAADKEDGTSREPLNESKLDTSRFKVVKLKGRNPIIFSPEQLPDIQSFLKSEAEYNREESPTKSLLKVKSVDNLNNQSTSENSNMDIIHSVGLVRKTPEKVISHQSYSRAYSWNRPGAKVASKPITAEKIQPDSQTNDYEIEETWNDIKEEHIEDDATWDQLPEMTSPKEQMMTQFSPVVDRAQTWNQVNEAKLELVAFQRRLLEEQHKKNLEYMKKEHDLKMTLLKAEIDLKRKQLNIML
uniref:MADF domain-containing protein n=1 Tax=Cuerna arida TaxID=1464854 RepID=A0A1B6EMY1_9HEMI